jgi:hypothetical protein
MHSGKWYEVDGVRLKENILKASQTKIPAGFCANEDFYE